MERRIFGLENEYGVTCTLRGQRRLSPDEVARYRGGEAKLVGFFVGQVMKRSGGKADPKRVSELLRSALG